MSAGAPRAIVELRSDTLTLPSKAMKEVVLEAPLGDDVFGEDPSVNALQEKVAAMMGKEAALFVPSGTMGNLICVLTHCQQRGSEIIIGDQSHIQLFEQGGIAQFGGIYPKVVKNLPDGTFSIDEMVSSVREDDVHYPITSLVAIENTHNMKGGKVLPLEWIDKVGKKCQDLGLPLHVDGARLLNSAIALNVPPARLVKDASSVTICLSKGLGAPVGSVISGSKAFIDRALRMRKALGGGMRQAGVLAAMGIFALENAESTLRRDHTRLADIHKGIRALNSEIVKTDLDKVHSNILIVDVSKSLLNAEQFVTRMEQVSDHELKTLKQAIVVRSLTLSETEIRFVTNCNMADGDVELIIKKLGYIIQEHQH